MVNLNVTRLCFVFVLILFVHMYGAVVVSYFVEESGVFFKFDVQVQGGETFWT